jgi:hypothetical protein
MAALNRKEILSELIKLGVNNTSELNFYLRKYKKYYRSHKTVSRKNALLKRNN